MGKGVIYTCIGVGLSALLVSTNRAMRRPLHRGTSNKVRLHVFLYVIYLNTNILCLGSTYIIVMYMSSQIISSVTLPLWLDDYIFNRLGATYCCSRSNMSVIDWNNVDVLNYLGTYFPRSFVESYSIFTSFLKKHAVIYDCKKELSIFDFGCGTGGEIIGLLLALSEQCKSLKLSLIHI